MDNNIKAMLMHLEGMEDPKAPTEDKYGPLKINAARYALSVGELCPEGSERATSLARLAESVMWANMAIRLARK